jgi:arginase
MPRPPYQVEAQEGTRIRNGISIRRFSETLALEVEASLVEGAFPLVIGGDCSILLGCLLGAKHSQSTPIGLVHVDGHSDFYHPGNYDSASRLGSAAGMDLALATGRGEPLLSSWGEPSEPLVKDADTMQIGERENRQSDFAYPDINDTAIGRLDIFKLQAMSPEATATSALAHIAPSDVWLHIDLDVLDESVMPAVDSPGRPGLAFDYLTRLVCALRSSGRIIGADVTIYDPDLDPDGQYAASIVSALATMFGDRSL